MFVAFDQWGSISEDSLYFLLWNHAKICLAKKLRLAWSVARPPSSTWHFIVFTLYSCAEPMLMDPGCHSTALPLCVQDEETLSYIQGVAGEGQMYSWQGCRGQIQSLGGKK